MLPLKTLLSLWMPFIFFCFLPDSKTVVPEKVELCSWYCCGQEIATACTSSNCNLLFIIIIILVFLYHCCFPQKLSANFNTSFTEQWCWDYMYNGSKQIFIPSLLNLFCCLLIRSTVTFHMIPAMGGRGLQNNERDIFPLKSILRWQIYFEAALKPVKMFCKSDFSCVQVSSVQPWSPPGSLCRNCQGQLGVAAETCVFLSLSGSVSTHCNRLPCPPPNVRCCPTCCGGSSLTGEVPQLTTSSASFGTGWAGMLDSPWWRSQWNNPAFLL